MFHGGIGIDFVSLSQPPGSGDQDKFVDERSARATATEADKDAGYLTDTNNVPAAPPPSTS